MLQGRWTAHVLTGLAPLIALVLLLFALRAMSPAPIPAHAVGPSAGAPEPWCGGGLGAPCLRP
jgi:hypothetical protein